jgi:DNA-binding LacI/PurR family transcriptional regulator
MIKQIPKSASLPKFRQLADDLRQQIINGQLPVGEPLPTYANLQAKFGCAQNTLEKALSVLEQEGLIFRKPSSGVYVAPRSKAPAQTGFIGYVDDRWQRSKNQLYYTQLLAGVREAAEQAGKQIVLIHAFNSFKQWDQLEGVLFCAAGHHFGFSSDDFLPYMPQGMPVVNLLFPLQGMPSVLADDASGMRQLVEHLVGLGHQRISYLTQVHFPLMAQHPLLQVRYRSYLKTMEANNIAVQPEWIFSPSILHEPDYVHYGYESMKLWIKNGWEDLQCTALLCQNDLCAMGAMNALQEAGFCVPDDVSVAGYDGSEIFCIKSCGLTTAQVPLQEIGSTGLNILAERIKNPQVNQRNVMLPVQLLKGKTTAAVNQKYIVAQAV